MMQAPSHMFSVMQHTVAREKLHLVVEVGQPDLVSAEVLLGLGGCNPFRVVAEPITTPMVSQHMLVNVDAAGHLQLQ